MKKTKLLIFTTLAMGILFIFSCNEEFINLNNQPDDIQSNALLEVSYKMTTSRDYEMGTNTLSSLELSGFNPSNEKQEVKMQLYESGQMDITIQELDFDQKIPNPHKILPDDTPNIIKTVIKGNIVKFYDETGNLIGSDNIPLPNHLELVKTIKNIGNDFTSEDINDVIATMQGHHLIKNLEDYIKNLENQRTNLQKSIGNPIQIIEQGNNFVTLRMPLNNIEMGMQEDAVLLIDKNLNKVVGTRIYSDNNQLLQSTFFGYNSGEVQSLNAIKTTQKIPLISGGEVEMISYSKIDDMEFNLNL